MYLSYSCILSPCIPSPPPPYHSCPLSSHPQLYVSSVSVFYHRSGLKLFLMLVAFLLAMLTALSRISDHKHHPTDVLSGLVIGAAVAIGIVSAKLLPLEEVEYLRCLCMLSHTISSLLPPSSPPHTHTHTHTHRYTTTYHSLVVSSASHSTKTTMKVYFLARRAMVLNRNHQKLIIHNHYLPLTFNTFCM